MFKLNQITRIERTLITLYSIYSDSISSLSPTSLEPLSACVIVWFPLEGSSTFLPFLTLERVHSRNLCNGILEIFIIKFEGLLDLKNTLYIISECIDAGTILARAIPDLELIESRFKLNNDAVDFILI